MSSLSDTLSSRKHEREFARLRRSSSSVGRLVGVSLILAAAVGIVVYSINQVSSSADSLEVARRELVSTGRGWTREFVDSQQIYRRWFESHGITAEARLFDNISELLFRSAATYSERFGRGEELGFFSQAYLSLHSGVMRIAFILIAAWRLWLAGIAGALLLAGIRLRVHRGADILGQTGNNRLFFSGARVGLENLNDRGTPELQVPGLACPARESLAVVRNSAIGRLLVSFGAANETTMGLAGVIIKHATMPAFVARHDEDALLAQAFSGAGLASQTELTLARALSLHEFYRDCAVDGAPVHDTPDFIEESSGGEGSFDSYQYADRIQAALHRVITPVQRGHLALLAPADVAAAILALEAGKVLAYAHEGGKWLRKSNFPQLAARAVLHALPSFGREYDFERRSSIRRALVFGSRRSDFAPIRFPIDLADESRALRQWTEILLAVPHELQAVSDEVELLGLVTEAHTRWHQIFFDEAMALDPAAVDNVISTHGNLFFMPVERVLQVLRRAVDDPELSRMEALIASVSNQQRLETMSRDLSGDAEGAPTVRSAERVLAPLSHAEMKSLASLHGLSPESLREWSSLRVVLNSFGWLARRVGDNSVPESSVVFAVCETEPGRAGVNELGLLGRSGMVPLRGTRLAERWGRSWQNRFHLVERARMAESREDYERLLKGLEDPIDEASVSAAIQG